MVLFKKKVKPGEHEILKEGPEEIIHINYESYPRVPSIEDDPIVMASVVEKLSQIPSIGRIVFHQKKKYEYNYNQTQMLVEVSQIYSHFIKQKSILTQAALEIFGPLPDASARIRNLQNIILNLLRTDPIGAFVETKRLLREEKINLSKNPPEEYKNSIQPYISVITEIYSLLADTKLIANAKDFLEGYNIGGREAYKKLFYPIITPDFMYTRLIVTPPIDAEVIDSYSLSKNTHVQILNTKDTIKPLYHVTPPEFQLSEDKYELLELARKVLAEHQPKAEEFIDPEKMRETFFNIGRDLITELAETKRLDLKFNEIEELAHVLVRYTVGFGLIETLLQDEDVQDIAINSPPGTTPMFLVHGKYDECITNITPSVEDVEGWASKFRLISARPLDEANPVLDTELIIPGVRARVAIISRPLNPTGLAFSIRRHRDKPWTFPLYIENKMMNDLAAGLLSFIIDGSRSILIAGTRGSGKTSVLGSVLVEIMRKYRVISIEDSVIGDCEILIKRGNKIEKSTIGNLIDSNISSYGSWYNLSDHEISGNYEGVEILTRNKENKIIWAKPIKLIRHKVNKNIYEIKTRTGRTIKVTKDHSLFTLGDDCEIKEIKPTEINTGSYIATPRKIPLNEKDILSINILDYFDRLNKGFLIGDKIKEFIKKNYIEIKQLAKENKYTRTIPSRWLRKGILPVEILKDLNCLSINIKKEKEIYFKISGNSAKLSSEIKIDKELLTLIGIWLADGCYDKNSIIFSTFDQEDREIVKNVAQKLGLPVKIHSDGGSHMINSKTLKFLFKEIFELRGNAYTKKVPDWIFSLSKKQISYVLKGIFSGDGCVSKNEIVIPLSSLQLLKDIQTLLLGFEINLRIGKKRKDETYNAGISNLKGWIKFKENIGILQKYKQERLEKLCNKNPTHDKTDIIPLSQIFKKQLGNIIKNQRIYNTNDYINRNNNLGREKLARIISITQTQDMEIRKLQLLADSDLFWDEVSEINLLKNEETYVYDLSVPEYENFIVNNILAHNTLELPTEALRQFGYNIQSMKVRSALLKSGSELGADEGIRTSLRMGDSSLIVGEIRSNEAFALYEAMRVGALANVVAGTIHGDSPYGVFDRVVNDLQVPRTSFKATDIIIIANPVRSADGLHRFRRITQITEVRKEWETDPLTEGGFVDLMRYDSKLDTLVPTDELINGDSEIIKSIASNVREWAGNWGAIWENILLRAKIKKTLVEYAKNYNVPDLLEAKTAIQMNDEFHRVSDRINQELGKLEPNKIFFEWEESLKKYIKLNYKI
ncbi:Flp pilus assembly complex ATPase component TadA [Candidatus Woesearchaeota archaeon]|nr:Flp pilus assembly complex ATPase component TadA [Candidatus Woesearchaeota archaeon]